MDARTDDHPWDRLRSEFHLPPGQIYLDGNSLGLLSRSAETKLNEAIAAWKQFGIGAWESAGWIDLPKAAATGWRS